jgi:hypothetical protein
MNEKIETKQPKQRRLRNCLVGALLIVALPFVVYYLIQSGYCRGWWGKQNLIMRSLWLCSCSSGLEQTFYPENVEVMFSACEDVLLVPTWDGYFFISGDETFYYGQSYILNGYTSEKVAYVLPNQGRQSFHFYTHELVYITYGRSRSPEIHHTDGSFVVLEPLPEPVPPPFLDDGAINPQMVALFDSRERIFLHRSPNPFLVVLGNYAVNDSGSSFILSRGRFPDLETEWPIRFIEESGLPFINIPPPHRAISPDGRFRAQNEGIYDMTTGEQIVDMIAVSTHIIPEFKRSFYRPCCWWPDGRAVIYLPHLLFPSELAPFTTSGPFHFEIGAPLARGEVNLPILKVHLPAE